MPVRGGKPVDRKRLLPEEISRLLSLQKSVNLPEWTYTETSQSIKVILEFSKIERKQNSRSERKKERSKRRFLEWKKKRQERYQQKENKETNEGEDRPTDKCTNDNMENMQSDERLEEETQSMEIMQDEERLEESDNSSESKLEESDTESEEYESSETTSESQDSQQSTYDVNKQPNETVKVNREETISDGNDKRQEIVKPVSSKTTEAERSKVTARKQDQRLTNENAKSEIVTSKTTEAERSNVTARQQDQRLTNENAKSDQACSNETKEIETGWILVGKRAKKEHCIDQLLKDINDRRKNFKFKPIDKEKLLEDVHYNYKTETEMIGTLMRMNEGKVDMNNLRICPLCTSTGIRLCSNEKHKEAQLIIPDYRTTTLYHFSVELWRKSFEIRRAKRLKEQQILIQKYEQQREQRRKNHEQKEKENHSKNIK